MPITAANRGRYPHNWKAISHHVRFVRANGQCECDGRCGSGKHKGRCVERHLQPSTINGKKIVITTAHLDHQPENVDDANLMAMCAPCHLAYDHDLHVRSRNARAARRTA